MRKVIVSIIFILSTSFIHGQGLYSFMLDENFYNTFLYIGDQYYEQEKYDSALMVYNIPYEILRRTMVEKNHEIVFQKLNSSKNAKVWTILNMKMGKVYYFLDRDREAITHLETSVREFQQGKYTSQYLTSSYYFLGLAYSAENSYKYSLENYFNCLRLFEKDHSTHNIDAGLVYMDVGNIYGFQRDYSEARYYYEKAMTILRQEDSALLDKVSIIYNNLGSICYALGELDQSIFYYKKAISLLEDSVKMHNSDLSMYYNNLAGVYSVREDYGKAEKLYQKSLNILRENVLGNYVDKGFLYYQLSTISYYSNDYKKALERISRSIINNVCYFDTALRVPDIDFSKTLNFNLMSLSLSLRAQIMKKIFEQSGDDIDFHRATAAFELMLLYFKNISKSKRINDNYNLYYTIQRDGIGSAIELYFNQSNLLSKDSINKVFKLIETGKSVQLLRSLHEADAKNVSNIPDSLLLIEQKLLEGIDDTDVRIELADKNTDQSILPSELYHLIATRNNLQKKLNHLIENFDSNYHDYFQLKYQSINYNVENIQNNLEDSIALIEYYIVDSNIYIIFISKNHHQIVHQVCDSLNDIISSHLQDIRFSNTESVYKSGVGLYQILFSCIEDYLETINRLIIIPDGILFYFPFETLVSNLRPRVNKPEFLVQKYCISYQYSLSIWLYSQRSKKYPNINSKKLFLGVAPFGKAIITPSMEQLPNSQNEVETINNILLNKGFETHIMYDTNATKDKFQNICSKFSHIHIASHGIHRPDNGPLTSILFFSAEKEICNIESAINNQLYVGEAYNLPLNAELVVLSACKSGIGERIKGEGLNSVARGFYYSGAKNVIFSLWNIDDKSSMKLFIEFYKNLSRGLDPSKALQEAKIFLIQSQGTSLPIFWSGLVLLGSNEY